MYLSRYGITLLFCLGTFCLAGQNKDFDSFISRISDQYQVDVAIAPELLPTLDSIRNVGTEIKSVEELLHRLLNHSGITYQILDGNKLMLRRENPADEHPMQAVLYGTILDAQSGEPLPYATIHIPDLNTGSHTDENGRFILPVRDTSGVVQINYLGYKTRTLPINEFIGKSVDIRMKTEEIPLKEVVVIVPYKLVEQDYSDQSTNLQGFAIISEQQLLTWNSENLITSLTGYTHYSSDEGIRIRSSEAGNSLILMDEIPVYDPYHFYNIFSPFSGLYFSSVEVFKNNLPIEYGGRIDGMIRLGSGRQSSVSNLILDTDLLMSSFSTQIALSPKASFTAGARISHTGLLHDALQDSTVTNFSLPGKFKDENEWSTSQQPTSDFYDINAGFTLMPSENNTLSFHFFDSKDRLDNSIQTAFEALIHQHEVIAIEQSYISNDKWKNTGFSGGWEQKISEKWSLNMLAFYSEFEKQVDYVSSFSERRFGSTIHSMHSGFQESELKSAGLKGFIQEHDAGSNHYTIGAEIQGHLIDFSAREDNTSFIAQSQHETEVTLFGDYRGQLWDKLNLSIGSRFTYLNSTSEIYPLPSVGLHYIIDDHYSIRTSFSKNLQSVHEITLENRYGRELDYFVLSEPTQGYPVLKSDKYMLGAGYNTSSWSFDVEGYYKKMDGLTSVRPLRPDPSHDDPGAPDEFYKLFTGDGWTAGMDFTVLYKHRNVETSLLYTFSKIEERYDKLFNGNYFSPQEDRRHQLKSAVVYKFGKFQASTLLTYKSKAPYLSLVRLEGRDGIGMADQGTVYRYLPPYFSLDLGLDYSFTLFKQPALIGVSLINATNHENINDLQHIGKVNRDGAAGLYITSQTELLGRTGNVHFRYLID